jgi:CRP-like cAMP-binding protein
MQMHTSMSQETVARRIARVLVELAEKNGPTLQFTRREIAALAGTTVETTIRVTGAFMRKNWISSTRGRIVISNLEQLKAVVY